jgi:mono/diheme cytochrome c family protein
MRIAVIAAICVTATLLVLDRIGSTETVVQRGAYLVNTIAACGRCHTPRDAQGNPIAAMELAGGFEFDDGVIGHVVGPNITPDRDTGIGKWTEGQIIAALRYGTRPDGTIIGAPMPIAAYRDISDSDLTAIAKYLHGIRPVRHPVARTRYKTAPAAQDPATIHVEAPPPQDKLAYGAYLAGPVGHCYGCHTILRADGSSLDRRWFYAGGRELPDYGDVTRQVVSRNITADPADGIGKWSDAEIKRAIATGIRPDGTRLARTMPSHWYKGIATADLDALVAFLRTVKPLKTPD